MPGVKRYMRKSEILRDIVEFLVEEEVLPPEAAKEISVTPRSTCKSPGRDTQAGEWRVSDNEVRIKELELERARTDLDRERIAAINVNRSDRYENERYFDVAKFARMVPSFKEDGVEKHFPHFEKVAQIMASLVVRGWKGKDIRLRCEIEEKPLIVFWGKLSLSEQQSRETKATYNEGTFESRDGRFQMDSDFSLVITDLEVADEGLYICQVGFTNENFESSTLLTISSKRPPELTKTQVQQCKIELKRYYLESLRTVRVDPLNFMERVNLDDIYTNVSLIESNMRETPMTYQDILVNDEYGHISKRILIQGEGGVGKTTLCAKIAWDWCQGRILQDLDMVIVIPLRDVTDGRRIGAIVKSFLSDSNAATPEQIDGYISTNLDEILLVFDGFDEFSEDLEERSNSEVIRILALEQYESCKVIVTTRPWRSRTFKKTKKLSKAYTFIRVEGFNESDLATYIKRYFMITQKSALAESLISFMEENEIVRSNMAPFPIYCAMLCLMWNDISEEKRKEMTKLQTFSNIFGEMISFLKEHYASKVCKHEHEQDQGVAYHLTEAGTVIQDISEIAMNGLIDKTLSFPEEHFKDCHDAMTKCCRVGILTRDEDVTRGKRRHDINNPSLVESVVSFPHKLFQEYVAGVYVSKVYVNDRAKYNQLKQKLISRYKEFRYLLYFVSASRNELGLDIIECLLNFAERNFCIDVAFECHTEEAARVVGERYEKYVLSPYTSEHTKSGVVFMVQCDQVRSLYLGEVTCGRTQSHDLALEMCSSCMMSKMTIHNSEFHSEFYEIIGDKASTCKTKAGQPLEASVVSFHYVDQHAAVALSLQPACSFRIRIMCVNTFCTT
ncbi:uncharacterized protein [Diadema setosum]|uniref:uncharacterized protein n=1 Tax=Diadema setosum TaxID=31175 RepID=UPI003B3A368D